MAEHRLKTLETKCSRKQTKTDINWRVQTTQLICMLWRTASRELQQTTADLKSRRNRNEPGEKQKERKKKYKTDETVNEQLNVGLANSNPGLHLRIMSNTFNAAYVYNIVVLQRWKNKITKLVRFDEQLECRFFSRRFADEYLSSRNRRKRRRLIYE